MQLQVKIYNVNQCVTLLHDECFFFRKTLPSNFANLVVNEAAAEFLRLDDSFAEAQEYGHRMHNWQCV